MQACCSGERAELSTAAPTLCYGVDIVNAVRVGRAFDRWRDQYEGRVLNQDERCWATPQRIAQAVAIKEAAAKALPPGERTAWLDVGLKAPTTARANDTSPAVECLRYLIGRRQTTIVVAGVAVREFSLLAASACVDDFAVAVAVVGKW